MLLARIFSADSHIRFTLLYRLWVICAGGVGILGVPFWFGAIEQGYFYTFSSLVAAQVLFELGTTFVITQLTAHEKSRPHEEGSGDVEPLDRVALILGFSDRWFRRAALLFLAAIGGFGCVFFSNTGTLSAADWLGPWCLLVVASAFTMRFAPQLALLEGAGEIGEVARLRLGQSLVGNLVMWTLLFLGMKLWALPIVPATAALFSFVWLRRHALIRNLQVRRARGIRSVLDWRTEVLPLQWRIALSWASGYLIFQAITPIAFAKLGTVAAGQIGLALAIFSGVQSVGMSWMYAKTPRYAELVARNQREHLNSLFTETLKRTVFVVGIGVLLILVGALLFDRIAPRLAERLPPVDAMACLAVASLINSVIFSLALYMRSHKEEPMLISSVVGGLITFASVYVAASYGLLATAMAFMLVTTVLGLPWAWLLFRPYYARTAQHG